VTTKIAISELFLPRRGYQSPPRDIRAEAELGPALKVP